MKIAVIPLFVLAFCVGCGRQHVITGEPIVYRVDPLSGALLDRDIIRPAAQTPLGVTPHKDEIVTLVLNNVFIKKLESLLGRHVLVYAEVYDDGNNDPSTAYTRVLFNQRGQPGNVNLGVADEIIYGPAPFKGHPIKLKIFVVQLAKEQKESFARVLNAAGTLAATAQPAAAPAVGVLIQAARLVNELTEDDFELRFSLTLFPMNELGTAVIGESVLDEQGEPSQRHGAATTLVSSLRTGSYVVVKRELERRYRDDAERQANLTSTLKLDMAQQAFVTRYEGSDERGVELLRLHGGYLYRVFAGKFGEEGELVPGAMQYRPRIGPNRGLDVVLVPGIRERYEDQTYVVMSVLTGLPVGVDPEAQRASSNRDLQLVQSLLDNPRDLSISERIGPAIDNLAASLKTAMQTRRIAQDAARRVGRDPSFRTSVQYPLFWTSQIRPLDDLKGDLARQDAVAANAAVLSVLSDIVINLPNLSPEDATQMRNLRGLTEESFESADQSPTSDEGAAPATEGSATSSGATTAKGLFRLTKAGLEALAKTASSSNGNRPQEAEERTEPDTAGTGTGGSQ